MNIFRFLTGKRGAIKLANASLVVSVAAAGLFYVGANTAANKQIAKERQVRSLSGVANTNNPYEGMQRRGRMLTSMNFRDGQNQLASEEDLANRTGNDALARYGANQRALGKLESTLGAYQFGDSDELNTANRDVAMNPTQLQVGNPNVAGMEGTLADGASGAAARAGAAGAGSAGARSSLAPASMARGSGTGVNVAGANPAATASGPRMGGRPQGGGLSGVMPGGSLPSRLKEGSPLQASASFDRGYRDSRAARRGHDVSDRDQLRDIVKKSAAAVRNTNAGANEGSKPFMSGGPGSGGMSVEGDNAPQTATSADLAAKTNAKLKNIGNRLDKEKDLTEERNQANENLIWQFLLTAAGSLGAIFAFSAILQKMDLKIKVMEKVALSLASNPMTAKMAAAMKIRIAALKTTRLLTAIGFVTAVVAANGFLFAAAKSFSSKYGSMGGTWVATAAQIAAPLLVGAAVQTAIEPKWSQFFKKVWSNFSGSITNIGMSMFPKA